MSRSDWERINRLLDDAAAKVLVPDPLRTVLKNGVAEPTYRLAIPSDIWLEGDSPEESGGPQPPSPILSWWSNDKMQFADPHSSCLTSFVRLADNESPHKVVAFARQWGVLGICNHGRPATHSHRCTALDVNYRFWEDQITKRNWTSARLGANNKLTLDTPWDIDEWISFGDPSWEPIEIWFHFSRAFKAIMQIAHSLRLG